MIFFVLLSLLNGIVVSISRVMNSRLSEDTGPVSASLWNHLIGFGFITVIFLIRNELRFDIYLHLPWTTYLGGVFGSFFVALNSHVFVRLGATLSILLVISGQMISSVLIDYRKGTLDSLLGQILGITIIILGVFLAKVKRLPKDEIE